ncbi:MAG TPA: TA system VapC family ribonuclease toxin [Nocardioidaceae bacterium]|nr:TA system VapC family ribonuclease toxin [Nocardioidaceae bacterium]
MSPVRLLDVNVLVALTKQTHLHQSAAFRWLESLPDDARWATCPLTEASFLRLMANPAVAGERHSIEVVLALLNSLDTRPGRAFLADPTSLRQPMIDTSRIVGHQQVTDFHLVNLAASSNAVFATFDQRIRDALAPEDRRHVEVIPV